ncbi:MAG: cyclic-di-AMP receptor [Anaerolineae bacterium]
MKLLMAIIRDDYAADVLAALTEEGLSATRISSTGGFWRRGNVTLMIGVEDQAVDRTLDIINANAGPEIQTTATDTAHPPRRATVFVLGVTGFEHY